jgi:hypothetical protein
MVHDRSWCCALGTIESIEKKVIYSRGHCSYCADRRDDVRIEVSSARRAQLIFGQLVGLFATTEQGSAATGWRLVAHGRLRLADPRRAGLFQKPFRRWFFVLEADTGLLVDGMEIFDKYHGARPLLLSLPVVHVAQVQTTRPSCPTAGPVLVPGAFRCSCELHVIQSGTERRTAAPAALLGRAHTRVRVAACCACSSLSPVHPSPACRRLLLEGYTLTAD